MKTALIGQAYTARSNILACDRMINMYVESASSDAKEPEMIKRWPGFDAYSNTVSNDGVRALYVASTGICFALIENQFYAVSGGSLNLLPGTMDTASGPIGITDNGQQLFVVDGTYGYIMPFSTMTIGRITDPDFPNGAVVALYMDTYFLTNVPNSFSFQWSAQNDGTSWDALDFASAEGSPDYITAGIVVNRELWWFGPQSKEVFYSTGTDTVFDRVTGGFTDQGCTAPHALIQADNTCFWLGQDKNGTAMIYKGRGYTSTRVSTHAIEWHMAEYSTLADCIAWAMQMDGHTFIIFTFPTAAKTWAFDISTNAWSELASLGDDGNFAQYRPCYHVLFEGKHLVADPQEGRVLRMTMDVCAELDRPMKSLRSWRQTNAEKKLQKFTTLEIDCQMGQGAVVGQGSDPLLMLRYSNDGGNQFVSERTCSIGAVGHYENLTRFWDLGMCRDRVWEISITDPVPFAIVGAYLEGQVLNA